MDRNGKIGKIKEIMEYLGISYDIQGEEEDFTMFFDDDEGLFNVIIDQEDDVILQFDVFMPPTKIAILTETFINHKLTPDLYDKFYIDAEGEMYLGDEAEKKRDMVLNWGESYLESTGQNYVQ